MHLFSLKKKGYITVLFGHLQLAFKFNDALGFFCGNSITKQNGKNNNDCFQTGFPNSPHYMQLVKKQIVPPQNSQ